MENPLGDFVLNEVGEMTEVGRVGMQGGGACRKNSIPVAAAAVTGGRAARGGGFRTSTAGT
jgi:hypothetical protein